MRHSASDATIQDLTRGGPGPPKLFGVNAQAWGRRKNK